MSQLDENDDLVQHEYSNRKHRIFTMFFSFLKKSVLYI